VRFAAVAGALSQTRERRLAFGYGTNGPVRAQGWIDATRLTRDRLAAGEYSKSLQSPLPLCLVQPDSKYHYP